LEPTYTVSELAGEIKEILSEAFRSFWVQGEIHRPRASARGHLYFELVEKGQGDSIVGKVDAVLWRSDHDRVKRQLARADQRLTDGIAIRCFGRIDYYGPSGRLQLVVREIDPAFGLGELERRRRETLAALQAAGLVDRNRGLELPPVPLRLGLVTSHGSAAYHDFLTGLEDSGYGFEVLLVHAAVQGRTAEPELSGALAALGNLDLDAVVMIRGGGSRSDLAAFDSRRVTEAVARCPLPVICGLGHEIDLSLADAVCHTSVKTPTKAAELLVARVAEAETRLETVRGELGVRSERCLARANEAMRRSERLARLAELRLEAKSSALEEMARRLSLLARRHSSAARHGVDELARRLASSTQRSLDRQRSRPDELGHRLVARASAELGRQRATLDGLARLCHGLAPQRLLERGYSITRDDGGRVLTSPDQVRSGDRLTTRLAAGELVSRVEDATGRTAEEGSPKEP
jgi:exodeoxyribonuclease VII large subunit